MSAGVTAQSGNGWLASARLCHFGALPADRGLEHGVQRLHLVEPARGVFDSRDHDIDYFYASRLKGEPVDGVDDVHFHVFQPRNLRLSARY